MEPTEHTRMIREARSEDVERIVEMGSRSLKEGPYHAMLADRPDITRALARRLIEQPNARILVAIDQDKTVGVFAFIVFPHYYSGEDVAGEMIWYVEPEARTSGFALELLWAAEKFASSLGAKKMQLTAPTDELAAAYQKLRGYAKVETAFQRDISCR